MRFSPHASQKRPESGVPQLTHAVLETSVTARSLTAVLTRAFRNLDGACVAVDDHPVASLDYVERIAIEIGDARHAHDDCAERDLRGHLVENQRLRRRAGEA